MPIDDIEYLQQNSVKEHVMVLIDSDNRDKRRWKSPNEFAINFPEPFTVQHVDALPQFLRAKT